MPITQAERDAILADLDADTAGLGRGTESGLPPAPRPGLVDEDDKGVKGKGKK
jgi:hypothetical protein